MTVMSGLMSCDGRRSYRSAEGVMWNTVYHVTYEADRDLHDSIVAEMKRVERSLSPFDKSRSSHASTVVTAWRPTHCYDAYLKPRSR